MKTKPTTPDWLQQAKDYAFETWRDRFGEPPGWPAKDYVRLSKLLALKGDSITLEDFKARWYRFLTTDKPFYRENGYGLGFFCSQFDAFGGVRAAKKSPTKEKAEREWYEQIIKYPKATTLNEKMFKARYEKERGIKKESG